MHIWISHVHIMFFKYLEQIMKLIVKHVQTQQIINILPLRCCWQSQLQEVYNLKSFSDVLVQFWPVAIQFPKVASSSMKIA